MRRTIVLSVLLIMLLMLSSCITVIGEKKDSSIEGTITSITKHGNAITDIAYENARKNGFEHGDIVTISSSDSYKKDAPIGTNFSDVDTGETIVLLGDDGLVLAVNYGSFAEESGLAEGSAITIAMKEKAGYLDEFNLRNLIMSDNRNDYDSDMAFANFREVKAGSILPGRLYRSCSPIEGDARAEYAYALMEKAGIRTVINLSDSEESAKDQMGDAPAYKEIAENGNAIFLDMTIEFFTPESTEKIAEAIRFIISHDAPYLIHCIEGKDRTGLMCAFIEALCGASIDEIISDYMKSFTDYYGVQPGTKQYETLSKTITDFFQTMNGRPFPWNSIGRATEAYAINTLGLSEDEIMLLRTKLTK